MLEPGNVSASPEAEGPGGEARGHSGTALWLWENRMRRSGETRRGRQKGKKLSKENMT